MSLFASAALFVAASFSSLTPAQQQEIDCLATFSVAQTEANADRVWGIPNMSDRVAKMAQSVGGKIGSWGLSTNDFANIMADRAINAMEVSAGGSARIAKMRPKVNTCKKYLPR